MNKIKKELFETFEDLKDVAINGETFTGGNKSYTYYGLEKTIDIDKILKSKIGNKVKYVPRFAISWLKSIIHEDEIPYFEEAHTAIFIKKYYCF